MTVAARCPRTANDRLFGNHILKRKRSKAFRRKGRGLRGTLRSTVVDQWARKHCGALPVSRGLVVVSYVQVLIADNQYYQAKIGYLQALAQRLQDTVALFVALGGGRWNAKEKAPGT